MTIQKAIEILKITCADSSGRDCPVTCEECKEAHNMAVEALEWKDRAISAMLGEDGEEE